VVGFGESSDPLGCGGEIERAQVGDQVTLEPAGVVKVELLQAFVGREAGCPDAFFPTVGLSGRDLALQAGDQKLLMGPGLGPGSLGQPGYRVAQGGCFECAGQNAISALRSRGGLVVERVLVVIYATPPSIPSRVS
jgi:hypothetical protein